MKDLKKMSSLSVGAIILLVSGVICKALGALFRLPLTNLLGIEGIGIFQLIMSLYAFALVVTCGGVTNSLSKLISTARGRGDTKSVSIYLKRSLLIALGTGIGIGLVFMIFGNYICNFQGIGNNQSYSLFIIILPLGASLTVLRGYFQGYQNMLPTAISQIVEQVFKFVFGLVFAFYFGKIGIAEGVFGAFVGITLSEVISVIYLFILFLIKNKDHEKLKELSSIKYARKEYDNAYFPLTLSASILPLVNAFDGLIIVPRLMQAGFSNGVATKLFGLQTGITGAILNFPLIISMAVTTTLLPNISYLISRGTGGRVVIERGLKILLFLILPTTFGMVAISRQVIFLVYQNMTTPILDTAFQFMLYGGFSVVFTALMQYLLMLLSANGEFKFILVVTAIGGGVKALLSFFLSAIPTINIYALILGNIVLSASVCVLAIFKLKRTIIFSVSFFEFFLLALGTVMMFFAVYTFISCNYFSIIVNIILAVILGAIIYLVITLPFLLKILPKTRKSAVNVV